MKATTLAVYLLVLNTCIFLTPIISTDESPEYNVQTLNSQSQTPTSTTSGRLLSSVNKTPSSSAPTSSPSSTGSSTGSSSDGVEGARFRPIHKKRGKAVDRHNLLKQVSPIVKATAMANVIAKEYGQGVKFSHAKDSSIAGERVHSVFFDQLAQESAIKVAGCGYSYHENAKGEIRTIDNLLNITTINWDFPQDNRHVSVVTISVLEKYVPSVAENLDIICEMQVFPSSLCDPFKNGYDYDGVATVGWFCQVSPLNDIYTLDAMDLSDYCPPKTNNQTASATAVYTGNVNINTLPHSGTHYLEDTNRTSTVVDCANGDCSSGVNKISDPDDAWNKTNERISTQVQWGTAQVLDYFRTVWGRNGLDGNGGPASILSEDGVTNLVGHKIHYGTNQTYAMWTGSDFVYGDGDGVTYGPMVSLDIIAHEMSHALVEYECNLDYSYQAGALRESFGDIVAAVLDYWTFGETNKTWKIGEDVYTPGIAGDAMRYMNEPHLADNKNFTFNDDPDHVSEMYNGTLDNGGVHVNSGIPNKVFYLLAKGGNHSNGGPSMTGIGIDAAFAIWYRAVTVYFASNTDFVAARTAMVHACIDLYGSGFKYTELNTAWALAGVGTLSVPTTNIVINGGFEGDTTGWTIAGNGCFFTRVSSDKRSGYGVMRMGVDNNLQGYVGQPFYIPPNSILANLTFWTWITTADIATLPRDTFTLEIANVTNNYLYNEMLALSNMDANSGYVQKVINLMPYMGKTGLKFQFRVNNDGNAPTIFRVDDVALTVITY